MAYEQREGDGALFKNDKREKDSHPNLRGSITVGGKEYWLSAWRKTGTAGKPDWLSLAATPKDATTESRASNAADDDIPF